MKRIQLETIQKLFLYFFMASIIGWCYEVFLEVVVYRWGFSNRGVLFGPYCPVYGVGLLAFMLCFNRLMDIELKWSVRWLRPIVVFVGCSVVATVIELIASYLLEWFTGSWPWDYLNYSLNFQGRIALSPSIRFGIGGVLFLYILRTAFAKLTSLMSKKVLNWISGIAAAILAIDIVVTFLLYIFVDHI